MVSSAPISTLFIGLNGLILFALSYIVVMERMSTRIWHGESKAEVSNQPNYLEKFSKWTAFVENYNPKVSCDQNRRRRNITVIYY
ncbi:MAG: hypothetical protein ACFCU5_14025 [Pleurocapsa sp.]